MAEYNSSENMVFAETALKNNNREEALVQLMNELSVHPDNIEALTLAGNVCINLKKYDVARGLFERACHFYPLNGDLHFLLGNAFYLLGNIGRAFELYADAELKGVSDKVRPNLYYQLALICSARGEYKAALVNFGKFEELDKTGESKTSLEVVSEKLRLYLLAGDRASALRYAVQLIALAPAQLGSYMAYYSLLMAGRDFDRAEKALDDAEKYADMTENDRLTVQAERVNILTERAEAEEDEEKAAQLLNRAYSYLSELIEQAPVSRQNELGLRLAEICMKRGEYAEAVAISSVFLPTDTLRTIEVPKTDTEIAPLTEEELEYMEARDHELISQMMASGELDGMADSGEIVYDEDGQPVRVYPEEQIRAAAERTAEKTEVPETPSPEAQENTRLKTDELDKLYYLLTSCYSAMGDHGNALKYGRLLKFSGNDRYSHYGRYVEAFSKKKLAGTSKEFTQEAAEEAYSDTLAYFRSQMMRNSYNYYPTLYRARMYAESGKYVKSEHLADLLGGKAKTEIMEYIGKCRAEVGEA